MHRRAVICLLLINCLLLSAAADSAPIDGTLNPSWSGVNVVVAVLEKIGASDAFETSEWFRLYKDNANTFLRILAYIRTKDGRLNSGGPGGIWNISEKDFNDTKIYLEGKPALQKAMFASPILHINWLQDVAYINMSIPMYSGLAIMLRLDEILQIDETRIGTFSQLYIDHFGGTSCGEWLGALNHLITYENCTIKSDIVFVVDSSISISPEELEETKKMIFNFTSELVTPNGDNRIGVILIRTTAVEHYTLGPSEGLTNDNKNEVLEKIEQIRYIPHHLTNTADGLCKVSTQPWRYMSDVIQIAIVFSDGGANFESAGSDRCGGDIESVAQHIHTNHSKIIVFTVGIGEDIDTTQLSLISSGNHVVKIKGYDDLNMLSGTLHYQICYTLPENTDIGREENGVMAKDQIMRWILEGVGGAGVTIRLCIRSGKITFYVSHFPNPSNVMNENQAIIETTDQLAVVCTTLFKNPIIPVGTSRRKKRSSHTSAEKIYISIIGNDEHSKFTLNTVEGNITIDVNECEQDPYPCHESATCHNTDGSFYCECQEGFSGDGFECTVTVIGVIHHDHDSRHLIVIIIVLAMSLLLVVIVFLAITLIIFLRSQRLRSTCRKTADARRPTFKQEDILTAKGNLRKVGTKVYPSATNTLAIQS